MGRVCIVHFLAHLEADLLVQGDGSVTEGDGVTKAGLSLYAPLGHVHDDLRALGTGVKQQWADRCRGTTGVQGQAAFWFLVASVSRRRKRAAQGV